MFKRLGAAVGVIVGVLALATPAFAWHIEGVKAHCDQGNSGLVLHVQVKLTDKGPGTYSDSTGASGSFGEVKTFNYQTIPADSITVNVEWFTEETASFATDTKNCEEVPPSTTTTTEVPTTTTTVPATTSTTTPEAPTTTVAPPTSTPATTPPAPTPAEPELALTGTGEAIGIGIAGLIVGGVGVWLERLGRNRRKRFIDLRDSGWS